MSQRTRIDKLREHQKSIEVFSDFDRSFKCHPVTGQLLKVTNDAALKQGIENKIKTVINERYCLPNEGSLVNRSLFEPNDQFLKESIKNSLMNAYQNDDRIKIHDVIVEVDDTNINILMKVIILGNNAFLDIPIILRRVN